MTTDAPEILQADPLEAALDVQEAELRAAVDAAFDQARRKPIAANRNAWRKACADLDQFLQERREPHAAVDRLFDGPPEALEYLEREWKVGKSKFYDDIKTGKLKKCDDGRLSLFDLEEYARCFLSKLDGTPGAKAGVNLQEQKTRAEIERINIDRRMRELKYKAETGELVPRSDVEIELAKRAGYLRSDLKNIFRALSGDIIRITKGDPATIPALISWGTVPGGVVDEIMDRYSRPIKGFEEE